MRSVRAKRQPPKTQPPPATHTPFSCSRISLASGSRRLYFLAESSGAVAGDREYVVRRDSGGLGDFRWLGGEGTVREGTQDACPRAGSERSPHQGLPDDEA